MALSTDARTYRWAAHRWRARLVRALAYACPLALSLAFVYAGSAAVPPPTSSLWAYLAWWLVISLGATLVISLGYRVTRRLLPLGAMLELSLIFPDRAPSRFEVALRTRTVDSLLERLQQPATTEKELSAQEAAEILLELVATLSEHDRVTRGHAERVRAYAAMLGERLGLPDDDLDRLNWAALLHDVGKLLVSAEILNKPGKPTEEEWEALRLHPLHGERLVAPLRHWLGEWADAVGHHHERWDGNGYPRGLAGEEIARAGRIVAIADVFDVMTSARSYKLGSSAAAAREELVRCAGSQFDPRLVRAFVDVSLGPMRLVVGPLSWLLHAPILSRIPLAPSLGAAAGGVAAVATIASGVASSPTQAAPTARPVSQPPPRVSTGTTASGPPSRALRVARPGRAAEESRPEGTGGDGPRIADEAPAPAPPDPAPEPPAPTPSPDPPPAPEPPPQPPPTDPEPSPPQPTPNQPPSFTPGGSQSVVEDGGPQSRAGWASAISPGPAAESSQRVTFSVTTDRPELFSSPPTVSSDGALSYTPAPDAFGVATVTVIARDDGGTADGGIDTSAPAAFSVTIRPVNDRPSFTAGGNDTAISLLGARTVSGWATSISCGPSNESSQSLRFVVTVDNPGLFTVQPAISPDGTLTYTPRLLALGVATAAVRLVDDGGTEDGGSDSSAPATFMITIV